MKSSILSSLLLSFLAAGAHGAMDARSPGNTPGKRPNIIFVLADDMGAGDTSSYGGKLAATPQLERLAKEGMRFTQYYSASPICSPSRCGLITGQFPARWNITSYLQTRSGNRQCEQVDFLDATAPSLPRVLRAAGYATAHIGKWHLGGGRDVENPPKFAAYGYDVGLGTYESPEPAPALGLKTVPWGPDANKEPQQVPRHDRTRWMVDQTIAFLNTNAGKPCFVNLWLDDTHAPWVPVNAVKGEGAARPNLIKVITELDRQIGRLLDAVPANTLLVFASDNGALPTFRGERNNGLRGSKLSLYEGGIRLPFIVRWPGHVPAGRVDESSVLHAVDMMPTFAALAGAALPSGYSSDGVDVSPVLLGKSFVRSKPLFWEYGRNTNAFAYPKEIADRSPNVAMRNDQWKLLVNADGTSAELYDLSTDPNESRNIAADHAETAGRMKSEALQWRASLPTLNGSTNAPAPAKGKPNVLFIPVDDLNHWVGHLGRNKQTKTPHLDRLAKMGVTFANAHCAAPICNPSRTALLSGLRPGATGIYDNGAHYSKGAGVTAAGSLVMQFKNAGYETLGMGKLWHGGLGFPGQWTATGGKESAARGKLDDRSIGGIKFGIITGGDECVSDTATTDWAIAELGRKHDKPFFLVPGFHKPHMPWNVPQKYYDMHPLAEIELPPAKEDDLADIPAAGVTMARLSGDHARVLASGRWKEAVQAYLAAISYLDGQVGRLLDALEKSDYKDNTIICLWGDHGWHLGEKEHWRKFALWEEATRAPFIWVVPGVTQPGGVCTRPVDFMSIYPTLCDLAGITKPAHVTGQSIRPLLADPHADWTTPALTTHGRNNHAIRTGRWRYIRYADGSEELYDHGNDDYEWTNLAAKPEYTALKQELAAFLPKDNVARIASDDASSDRPVGTPASDEAKATRRAKRQAERTSTSPKP